MSASPWNNQPGDRNFLSPVGFKFNLTKAPKVDFFANSANIPSITLGSSLQTRYGKNIDIPGDKMNFEDFRLRFLVDENLTNYMEIQNWMRGLGFPYSLEQYQDLIDDSEAYNNAALKGNFYEYSDATLQILNSNYNVSAQVIFTGMFPTYLSTLQFDATEQDIKYFTAEVNFKYTYYRIVSPTGTPL
jgi:hypothetical protein